MCFLTLFSEIPGRVVRYGQLSKPFLFFNPGNSFGKAKRRSEEASRSNEVTESLADSLPKPNCAMRIQIFLSEDCKKRPRRTPRLNIGF
ncbi:hypothetical protein DLM76_18495 [Leptospira yasudae]|nr:hypothetical protein DLM76_18495 [Leptospira yasudae]